MAKISDRFVRIHKEGYTFTDDGMRQLLVDKETGVTYITWKSGYAGGITPLLKADGTPVITRIS